MSVTFNPCVVIPCYNHGAMMARVIERLKPTGLPCFIIDDGSDDTTRQVLETLAKEHETLTLTRLAQNAGKGEAVIRGLQHAARAGFTHAIQVDADGQHAIEDIPKLLELARQHPQALISGQPVYDDSIPRSRRYGRWVTHVWVWIETLSLQLKDSMCGFRVYPIASTLRLAERVTLGKRMDFDTEVMVRLYWQGTPSYFVPTRVTYPQDGLSHFDALKDNVRISLMHTRLFFGMLPRIPSLLFRRSGSHWAQQQERKGLWGMRFMLLVWRVLGRRAFSLLLYPVVAVYWISAGNARRASQLWLARVCTTLALRGLAVPAKLNSYHHFLRFAEAMLDKVAGWRGELQLGRDVEFAPGTEAAMGLDDNKGKLLLASHLGDVEACRALAQLHNSKVINALVFHENAQRFKQIMQEMAPEAGVHLIPVTHIGPDTAMLLKDKLDKGEWVDRKSAFDTLFAFYRLVLTGLLFVALAVIAAGAVLRLGWKKGLISLVPSILSLGCGLAALSLSGHSLNLFSLLALVLVLGIGINYTLFFSNPRGTPLTSLLAIALAMATTLLTLGMLVFSATQAISSFGIVLVSGIFTAFLLSPLAMPGKKERKR